MHRGTVGFIAATLLIISAILFVIGKIGDSSESAMWLGATLRIGIVMGALWLALPKLERTPRWFAKGALLLVMILACIGGKVRVVALAMAVYIFVSWILPTFLPSGKPSERS